jgi:hypothetical protein
LVLLECGDWIGHLAVEHCGIGTNRVAVLGSDVDGDSVDFVDAIITGATAIGGGMVVLMITILRPRPVK